MERGFGLGFSPSLAKTLMEKRKEFDSLIHSPNSARVRVLETLLFLLLSFLAKISNWRRENLIFSNNPKIRLGFCVFISNRNLNNKEEENLNLILSLLV